jgi:hypothetical protein
MADNTLFHDGCNICLSIEAAFLGLFSANPNAFESVNLGLDTSRSAEAVRLGVTRLPSLVLGGKVMKVDDHSPIEHYLGTAQPERA